MKGDNFLKQPEIDGSLFRKSLRPRVRAESSPFSYVKNQVLLPFLKPFHNFFTTKKTDGTWRKAQISHILYSQIKTPQFLPPQKNHLPLDFWHF